MQEGESVFLILLEGDKNPALVIPIGGARAFFVSAFLKNGKLVKNYKKKQYK